MRHTTKAEDKSFPSGNIAAYARDSSTFKTVMRLGTSLMSTLDVVEPVPENHEDAPSGAAYRAHRGDASPNRNKRFFRCVALPSQLRQPGRDELVNPWLGDDGKPQKWADVGNGAQRIAKTGQRLALAEVCSRGVSADDWRRVCQIGLLLDEAAARRRALHHSLRCAGSSAVWSSIDGYRAAKSRNTR